VYSPVAAQTWVGGWGSCYNPSPPPLPPHPAFLHTWYVPETFVSVFETEAVSHFNGWPVPQKQIAQTPLVANAVNAVFGTADGESVVYAPTLHADASGGGGHTLQAHVGPVFFSAEAAAQIAPWNDSAPPVRGSETCINYSTRMDSYEWKTGNLDTTLANPTFDAILAASAAGSAAGYTVASSLLGYECSQTTTQTSTISFQSSTPVAGATCTPNPTQYQTTTTQQGWNCANTLENFRIAEQVRGCGRDCAYSILYISSVSESVDSYWSATDRSAPSNMACYLYISSPYPPSWPNGNGGRSGDHAAIGIKSGNSWTSVHDGSTCYSSPTGSWTGTVDLGTGCTPNMVETQVPLPTTYTCTETIQTPVTTTWSSSTGGPGCSPVYGSAASAAVSGAGLPAILCAAFGIPITPPNVVPLHEVSPYDASINRYMGGPVAVGGPGCAASTNTLPTVTLTENCYDTHFMFPRRGETREGDRNVAAAVTALKALDLGGSTAATINAIPGDFICSAYTGVCFPWGTPTQVVGQAGYTPDADGNSRWAWVVWRGRFACLDLPVFPFITDAEIAAFCGATQPALMSAELVRQAAVYAFP